MKKYISILAAIIILISSIYLPNGNVQAASKATKARKAYAAFLAKHSAADIKDEDFNDASFSLDDKTYVSSFSICDIDKDNVPELITYTGVNFRWFIVRIYTYKNSKVTPYKFNDGNDVEFDNCATANGSYNFYICSKGHIHNNYVGSYGSDYATYKVSGKKLKLSSSAENTHKDKKVKTYENSANNRSKLKKNKLK